MASLHLPGPIAVIDFETTGLFPFRNDRVIEVAVVIVDTNGKIANEFVSLVNPMRDVGRSSIHGLTSEDVQHAPRFEEIASLLIDTLKGSIAIAAHNVRFDKQFLESELSRIDCPLSDCFSLCTMHMAGGGKLSQCCADYEVALTGISHSALDDARATALLLACLLSDEPEVIQKLTRLSVIDWPMVKCPTKQTITRIQSHRLKTESPTYLHRLLERVSHSPSTSASNGSVMAYSALLDRVLEDRHIDESEGELLIETATRWGMTKEQILKTHRSYLDQLAIAAVADGIVSEAERRDLKVVARLLGQESQNLDEIIAEAAAKVVEVSKTPASSFSNDTSLAGKRVCFTGELQCKLNGVLITRELAEELATKAGTVVLTGVTKKLDILVLSDPHSQSGKAKKARQYGTRIMHEPVFWNAIGVNVD